MWMRDVYSTNVSQVGYDDETKELLVTWLKSGKTSAYQGVDEATALRLVTAPSVGTTINDEIKNRYPHRYV